MALPAAPTYFLVKFQTCIKALIFGLNFLSNLAKSAAGYATSCLLLCSKAAHCCPTNL